MSLEPSVLYFIIDFGFARPAGLLYLVSGTGIGELTCIGDIWASTFILHPEPRRTRTLATICEGMLGFWTELRGVSAD